MALPLNPAMSQKHLDKAVFSLDSLTAVVATLEMTFEKTPDATSNAVKSSATSVDGLPYHPALEAGGTPVRRLPDNLKLGRKRKTERQRRRFWTRRLAGSAGDMSARASCARVQEKGFKSAHLRAPMPPRVGANQALDVGPSVGAARKGSKYRQTMHQSANLPMRCEICPITRYFWKYHMAAHINHAHGGVGGAANGGTPQFRAKFAISTDERRQVLALLGKEPPPDNSARKRGGSTTNSTTTRSGRAVRARTAGGC